MTAASEGSVGPNRVNYLPGGPEALFHVGAVHTAAGSATGPMATGPWILGPAGRPALGSLGVLLDVVLGAAAIANRPEGWWAVTTEILLEAGGPLPTDGSGLVAAGQLVHHDQVGALAQGTVSDEYGHLVAVASTRVRYTPGLPTGANALPAGFSPRIDQPILEMLDARCSGAELTLATTVQNSNPMGVFHGGVALCLADVAGGLAVHSETHPLNTASLHITYVRPGPITGKARFVAVPAHRGRTLGAVHVECLRPDGKAFALATMTYQ